MRASKYTVKPTSQFKKDYKLAMKRGLDISLYWLLIYKLEDNVLILTLARTGTHSNLFNK
ncbi:hypothetical protein [Evtepia sp.]|jgi:mRNA interferase YafQ|uniref:hypothetical protein n=1 Tax=Evtepia sp. TaxID=2773933 RepID=UPI002E777E7C|nr:hypothetical protein [Evtepia sp.]MEE0256051.1 hypothetical protein [Evtepia sp.]